MVLLVAERKEKFSLNIVATEVGSMVVSSGSPTATECEANSVTSEIRGELLDEIWSATGGSLMEACRTISQPAQSLAG